MNQVDYPTVKMAVVNGFVAPMAKRAGSDGQLDSQLAELTLASRRKDEFLAQLSHELRTPLASIQYAAAALARSADTDSAQRARSLIERQVRQIQRLLDDLLDTSMISRGGLRLDVTRCDLRTVLGHAIETLQREIDEKGHRLIVTLPDVPLWVHADIRSLERVFVNLLSNAYRYTDEGGEVRLAAEAHEGQAVVRIRDSGIGIAPDAIGHVFELFNRAVGSEYRSRAGLGVGLAVVSAIVSAHAGSVIAASEGVGRGSEFTVRLPLG